MVTSEDKWSELALEIIHQKFELMNSITETEMDRDLVTVKLGELKAFTFLQVLMEELEKEYGEA
jgi:hypothetical protein